MWRVSNDYLAALLTDHAMTVRVDVFTPSGLRATDIPVTDGTITATLLADVCRSGTIFVSRSLVREGLFDPAHDRVQILTGVEGFPLIPIFTGRVVDTASSGSGGAQIQVEDFGRDVVQAKFEQPWQVTNRMSAAQEIRNLIIDVDDTFGVDLSRALSGSAPSVTWEEDRARAADELAAAINCIWQADRVGGFEVYPNPYNFTTPPPTVLTLTDGPTGNINSLVENVTRDGVFNSVTVQVERSDGSPPMRVTVRDRRPHSKFRWGGPYGKVNQVVRLQTPGGRGEAFRMAERILNQSLGLYRSWRLSTPHFPLLDPGDVIGVTEVDDGNTTVQVVETLNYSLSAIEESSLATRELRYSTDEAVS